MYEPPPNLSSSSALPPGVPPPPGYVGPVPAALGLPQPQDRSLQLATIYEPSRRFNGIALVGAILAVALWLIRVFLRIGSLNRLYVGGWRDQLSLALITLIFLLGCVLILSSSTLGAGLTTGALLSLFPLIAQTVQTRPHVFSAERFVGVAAVVTVSVMIFAAMSEARRSDAETNGATLAAGLAVLLVALGQVTTWTRGTPYFDMWCFIAVAMGLGLRSRVGSAIVIGALAPRAIPNMIFLVGSQAGRKRLFGGPTLELLCGLILAIVCLVRAISADERQQSVQAEVW